VQTFTSNGTWTKPSGIISTSRTTVILVGGGAGGGSGARRALGTASSGGSGGGGGQRVEFDVATSLLGATEAVTVGTGGAGGAVTEMQGAPADQATARIAETFAFSLDRGAEPRRPIVPAESAVARFS
jgi:hypothetical protein